MSSGVFPVIRTFPSLEELFALTWVESNLLETLTGNSPLLISTLISPVRLYGQFIWRLPMVLVLHKEPGQSRCLGGASDKTENLAF